MIKIISAVVLLSAALAQAETIVSYPNGATVSVPEGWEVQIQPIGFNSLPYDPETNSSGKAPGWEGWPVYNYFLSLAGCTPGELVISPSICPPQPKFVTPYCATDPVEEPEEEEECHGNAWGVGHGTGQPDKENSCKDD